MAQIAEHDGIVTAVEEGKVKVQMHVVSACASCKAHDKCAFVDKAEKTVEVETTDWENYSIGDSVVVSVNESMGLLAVLLAYFIPAVLLVATVITFSRLHFSEGIVALLTLAIVTVYYLILYLVRNRLQKNFSFRLEEK